MIPASAIATLAVANSRAFSERVLPCCTASVCRIWLYSATGVPMPGRSYAQNSAESRLIFRAEGAHPIAEIVHFVVRGGVLGAVQTRWGDGKKIIDCRNGKWSDISRAGVNRPAEIRRSGNPIAGPISRLVKRIAAGCDRAGAMPRFDPRRIAHTSHPPSRPDRPQLTRETASVRLANTRFCRGYSFVSALAAAEATAASGSAPIVCAAEDLGTGSCVCSMPLSAS